MEYCNSNIILYILKHLRSTKHTNTSFAAQLPSLRRGRPVSLLTRLPLIQSKRNLCPIRRYRCATLPRRPDIHRRRRDPRKPGSRSRRTIRRSRARGRSRTVSSRRGQCDEARRVELRNSVLLCVLLLVLLLCLALGEGLRIEEL